MKTKYLLFGFFLFFIGNARAQEIKMLSNLSQELGTSDYRLMESVEMGGNLYFTTWSKKGAELWRTDGAITQAVYEWPMGSLNADYAVNKIYVYNNRLLFTGMDSAHGKELWISDGTTVGTRLLVDITPGPQSSFESLPLKSSYTGLEGHFIPFVGFDGKMCFVAGDQTGNNSLWVTDGTEAGTRPVQLLNANSGFGLGTQLGVYNNRSLILNAGFTQFDFGMFVSDGSQTGTSLLTNKVLSQDFFEGQGKLFFNRSGIAGFWTSDGTTSGTIPLDSTIRCSADKVWLNNKLCFFNATNGSQLFTSDGTPAGTQMLADNIRQSIKFTTSRFPPLYAQNSFPVVLKDNIYFCAYNQLWKSDGTQAGTQIVKNFVYDSLHSVPAMPTALITAGDKMYFKAWDGFRMDLFVSDGTSAGTRKLALPATNYSDYYYWDGFPIQASHSNENMILYGNKLLFTEIYDSSVGKALYMIDVAPLSVPPTATVQGELLVSPNPATSSLSIRYPENQFEQAAVVDVMGRNVYQQTISKKGYDVLNLPELASGQYFVRLSGNGHSVSAPVIITR